MKPPEWFQEACEKLWDEIMFSGFRQFPWNQQAKPFNADEACMGNFNPAFDQQPGILEARKVHFEMSYLSAEEKRLIVDALKKRIDQLPVEHRDWVLGL